MTGSAVFDPTGRYRYRLERTLDGGSGVVAFVMLNPSTADASRDDPTIRRCVGFAHDWGFAKLVVVNLFALRATSSATLLTAPDPAGPGNLGHLSSALASADLAVAAWGNLVARLAAPVLPDSAAPVACLGLTALGHPRHPLYVRRDTPLVSFPTLDRHGRPAQS